MQDVVAIVILTNPIMVLQIGMKHQGSQRLLIQSQKREAMSFQSNKRAKLSEKTASEFRSKKKALKKDGNFEVAISIGPEVFQ